MACTLGVWPLAYVSLAPHIFGSLKSYPHTRLSRVRLSREALLASKKIPLYVSLDALQEDIRLLVVHPGQGSTDIVCSLQTVSLLKNPTFTALSYAWDAPILHYHSKWTIHGLLQYVRKFFNIKQEPPKMTILVDGTPVLITPNLDAALHHLRRPDYPLKLWVDAICIDQNNSEEKEVQIQLMSRIYEQAETTYLWLGPAAEDSDTAMDFLASSAGSTMDEINALSPPFSALRALYARTWWTRIWVVQEALLSKNAIFKCGHKEIPMDTFVELANKERLYQRQWDASQGAVDMTSRPPWMFMSTAMPFFLPFLQRYYEQHPPSVSTRHNILSSKERPILVALLSTQTFSSTRPRDKIYGVLALASPTSREAIHTDYMGRKTDSDVFKEVMVHVLKSHDSLTPLHFSEGSRMPGLPSWVMNFSRISATDRDLTMLSNKSSFCASNTDLSWEYLVRPIGSIKWIRAAISRLYHTPFSIQERSTSHAMFSDNDNTLLLRGILVDTISFTGSIGNISDVQNMNDYTSFETLPTPQEMLHAVRVVIPDACRKWEQKIQSHLSNPYHTPQGRYNAFVHTLTVDQYVTNASELGASRAYNVMMGRFPSLFQPRMRDDMLMRSMHFISAVMETLNNKVFIVTERGFLGMAPKTSREGDAVCILQGGHVPFVVRPKGEGYWEFVGKCYVHGIMNGEVIKEAKRKDVQMFRLI